MNARWDTPFRCFGLVLLLGVLACAQGPRDFRPGSADELRDFVAQQSNTTSLEALKGAEVLLEGAVKNLWSCRSDTFRDQATGARYMFVVEVRKGSGSVLVSDVPSRGFNCVIWLGFPL